MNREGYNDPTAEIAVERVMRETLRMRRCSSCGKYVMPGKTCECLKKKRDYQG